MSVLTWLFLGLGVALVALLVLRERVTSVALWAVAAGALGALTGGWLVRWGGLASRGVLGDGAVAATLGAALFVAAYLTMVNIPRRSA